MKLKFPNLLISLAASTAIALVNPLNVTSSLAQDSQDSQTNVSQEKGEDSQKAKSVKNLSLAYSLAKYGRENKDPQMLIAAAKIIMETPVESLALEKSSEKIEEGTVAQGTKEDGERQDISASQLLAEARQLANNDPTIIAMITNVENSGSTSRGRVGGPTRHVDSVNARSVDNYSIPFQAGQVARIGVAGDGDTDLDCYIYDSNGNLVDRDTDYTDSCLLEFVPRWTGNFTLRIKNEGGVHNRYLLLTN